MPSLRLVQNITGFQGIASGAVGTLILPPSYRYHALHVWTTVSGALTNPVTVGSNFKLKVGGVTIRDMSPDQAIRLAKLFKVTPATGQLPIFFSEPWLADPRTREMFSWDMVGQGKFTMEFTCNAVVAGISNVVAEVDTIRNAVTDKTGKRAPFLKIMKCKTEAFVFAGAARLGNTTLDKSLPIRRLLIDASANTFSDAEVIADSVSVWNQIPLTAISGLLIPYGELGIDPTQFTMPLVFDYDGLGRSKLTAAALEVRLTATGAMTASFLNIQEASAFA